ncbi:unnamed protein product [Cuscuta campestris]|uniref:Non-specific lipid-transfer protein n=2 Tax=Cuscuta sect. Cleistogrammica TaxID=1824901 RepID=A0A484L4K7_9ASTE|nr:hypothetical protein DM860_016520 [Cuscuta australis]VFQ71134.1 unnamed protein product [Cuscuta campestris]
MAARVVIKSSVWLAAAAVVVMLVVASAPNGGEAAGITTCGQVVKPLMPCVPYLQGDGASPPPPACCQGITSVNSLAHTTPDRQTACNCLKNTAMKLNGLKPALALSLPSKCGVNIPYKISMNTDCTKVN